jgi:hypothetical protein
MQGHGQWYVNSLSGREPLENPRDRVFSDFSDRWIGRQHGVSLFGLATEPVGSRGLR